MKWNSFIWMNLSKKLSNSNADDCTTSLTESSPNDNISTNDNKESKNGKDLFFHRILFCKYFLVDIASFSEIIIKISLILS